MGWAGGSTVFDDVIAAVKPVVKDKEDRKKIYGPIIDAFENADWDTMDECLGQDEAYDEIYAEKYPEDTEED